MASMILKCHGSQSAPEIFFPQSAKTCTDIYAELLGIRRKFRLTMVLTTKKH